MRQKKQIQLSLTNKEQQKLNEICDDLGIDKDFLVSEALRKLLVESKESGKGECVC
jgi:hypothetical protein